MTGLVRAAGAISRNAHPFRRVMIYRIDETAVAERAGVSARPAFRGRH